MSLMETGAKPKPPVNILLVEDDDGDAKCLIRSFRNAKIANPIVRAVDGMEALEILQGKSDKQIPTPRLLLVDMNMPRMNGIQFIQCLRQDPVLKSSIVFMLTTSNRDEDRMAAYNLNVAGYLVKQNAGQDFLYVMNLMDCYGSVVEFP